MYKYFLYLLALPSCFCLTSIKAQDIASFKWWDPSKDKSIEGQGWYNGLAGPYERLPFKAKGVVTDGVWRFSKHSSGLYIRFRTNSKHIKVRYTVSQRLEMPHMPATGVSGVDLYGIDENGIWKWSRGQFKFQDTITFDFQGLDSTYNIRGREYMLYLPLYNQVNWLEIGVDVVDYFEPLPVQDKKPIVVYGTSIAQGACASRPGMSWVNILSRKLDQPFVNLGFSGNGRLEKEVINLLTEIEAEIYVLDCLPNLVRIDLFDDNELRRLISTSVMQLRHKKPWVPILLVDHAGFTDGMLHPSRQRSFQRVNNIQHEVFRQLVDEGTYGLFYLSKNEIKMDHDDMVDGTHPSDLGMMRYAIAYEKVFDKILNKPKR